MFKVNKNGTPCWFEVKAENHQDAVEKHFGIRVYHLTNWGKYIKVFSDTGDIALYSAYASHQEMSAFG